MNFLRGHKTCLLMNPQYLVTPSGGQEGKGAIAPPEDQISGVPK